MNRSPRPEPLRPAMRELQGFRTSPRIAAVFAVAVLSFWIGGPGTSEELGLWPRLAYGTGVQAICRLIALSCVAISQALAPAAWPWPARAAPGALLAASPMAAAVGGVNTTDIGEKVGLLDVVSSV